MWFLLRLCLSLLHFYCDTFLFSLGVYGDVMRVKILFNKKENALIQMSDGTQAQLGSHTQTCNTLFAFFDVALCFILFFFSHHLLQYIVLSLYLADPNLVGLALINCFPADNLLVSFILSTQMV